MCSLMCLAVCCNGLAKGQHKDVIDTMTVCLQWPDQIHANDSILTFGYSETVLVFLLEAAKKLDFQASSHVGRV